MRTNRDVLLLSIASRILLVSTAAGWDDGFTGTSGAASSSMSVSNAQSFLRKMASTCGVVSGYAAVTCPLCDLGAVEHRLDGIGCHVGEQGNFGDSVWKQPVSGDKVSAKIMPVWHEFKLHTSAQIHIWLSPRVVYLLFKGICSGVKKHWWWICRWMDGLQRVQEEADGVPEA